MAFARPFPFSLHGDALVPHLLTTADHPWIRQLLELVTACAGEPHRTLAQRLRKQPVPARRSKWAFASELATKLSGARPESPIVPSRARAAVFGEAARTPAPRQTVLERVAAELGVDVEALASSLFADCPGERIVAPLRLAGPEDFALRANLALVKSLLCRAAAVRIELLGNARAVVRQAHLRRLICEVEDGDPVVLRVSGPFALFRHTALYGRALGELLPLLAWSDRFRLVAECQLFGRSCHLVVASGDPVLPSEPPRPFDSTVEERFAKDFLRATGDWSLVREPAPLRAGKTLVFPDFEARHNLTNERWLVEIVGFWTAEYLQDKLAHYRDAGAPNLLLCVRDDLRCAEEQLPTSASVVRFRTRIDVKAVLAVLESNNMGP